MYIVKSKFSVKLRQNGILYISPLLFQSRTERCDTHYMKKDMKIGFIGGDMRQVFCASEMAKLGFETALFGFDRCNSDIGLCTRCDNLEDALEMTDIVVLPLPATLDGVCVSSPLSDKCIPISRVVCGAKDCKMMLYGGSCPKLEQLAKQEEINIYDYYKREDYKVLNAEPTAEGAIAIAINEMPKTLESSKCLVLGYGRIGKLMCRQLLSFGAEVYASARKSEDLAWAKLAGCKTVYTNSISDVLKEFDLIVNTIPKMVLKDELLDLVRQDTFIIDLASKPGGIDFKMAKQRGLNVVWALSIPGKTAPVTAGKILSETILRIIDETPELSDS